MEKDTKVKQFICTKHPLSNYGCTCEQCIKEAIEKINDIWEKLNK